MGNKWVICFFFSLCLESSSSWNDFFVATKYENNRWKSVCVTNTSNALNWLPIRDLNYTLPLYQTPVSTYIPTPKFNDFDCKITNDHQTRKHFIKGDWKLQNSWESHLNEIIVDERWEELKVIHIPRANESWKIIPLQKISRNNFDISLSILMTGETHFFLCDGTNSSESNCYWFKMIHEYYNRTLIISKCEKGKIPSHNEVNATSRCSKEKRFKLTDSWVGTRWYNYRSSKKHDIITMDGISNEKYKFVEWKDSETFINVSHIVVVSKSDGAFLKLHIVDFLYTTTRNHSARLGPLIRILNNFVCVSMYISMCSACKIKLSLNSKFGIVKSETFEFNQTGWNSLKFITDNVLANEVWLEVLTLSTNPDSYWAIDKIRLCQKHEFRMMSINEYNADCLLVMNNNEHRRTHSSCFGISSTKINKCPVNTIGHFCVPCDFMFANCKKIKIGSEYDCECSSGYEGSSCRNECAAGTYGRGCQKSCGKCSNSTCNPVDGTCPKCIDGYYGPNCDKHEVLRFAAAPNIENVSYDAVNVSVTNFATIKYGTPVHFPKSYTLEYKEAQRSNNWVSIWELYPFNHSAMFRINKLQPETHYLVRGVIILDNGERQVDNFLNYANFSTECQDISHNNINIAQTNISVYVSLVKTTDVTCKLYSVSLLGSDKRGSVNSSGTLFQNLTPFTEYTVSFQKNQRSFGKTFWTREGVPTKIRNFTLKWISSTGVALQWSEPEQTYGEIQNYSIGYQHLHYLGCYPDNSKASKTTWYQTNDTFANITKLMPYSTYEFTIFGTNRKFDGPPLSKREKSEYLNEIEEEEKPTISRIEKNSTSATIVFSKIQCEKIRGSLNISIVVTCTSEWCKNENSKTETQTYQEIAITLNQLLPNTEYKLHILFCRENVFCGHNKVIKLRTKQSAPQNVLIYSKSLSSISLRWQLPNPLYGILKGFSVKCSDQSQKIQTFFLTETCKNWPNFYCINMTGLSKNRSYKIQVAAKNEETEELGEFVMVKAVTIFEKSNPPNNLKIEWTRENALIVEWEYPSRSSGDIKYFGIDITNLLTQELIEEKCNAKENTWNFTNQFKIEASELLVTTPYNITIFANNNYYNSSKIWKSTTSPPDIPTFRKTPEIHRRNHNINIKIFLDEPRGKSDSFHLFVLKTHQNSNSRFYEKLQMFDLTNLSIAVQCNFRSIQSLIEVTLGGSQQHRGCKDTENSALESGTNYNVTIILINSNNSQNRTAVYSDTQRTTDDSKQIAASIFLGILLLLALSVVVTCVCWRKKKSLRTQFLSDGNAAGEPCNETLIPLAPINSNPHIKRENELSTKELSKRSSEDGNILSKAVEMKNFENYVKSSLAKQELQKQHKLILKYTIAYETLHENLWYEYVDMEYITNLRIPNAYMIVKLTNPNEIKEFWKIIWHANVHNVVCFENVYTFNKKKIIDWPQPGKKINCGILTIQTKSIEKYQYYVHRKLRLKLKDKTRKISHFHFLHFSDNGFSLSPRRYVEFFQTISNICLHSSSPIAVISSAGMKDVGFALLCDICLRTAKKDGAVDVVANLQKLTQCSSELMIDFDHYVAVHEVLIESLYHMDTSIRRSDFDVNKTELFESEQVEKHIQFLMETLWLDHIKKEKEEDYNIYYGLSPSGRFKSMEKLMVVKQSSLSPLDDFLQVLKQEKVSVVVALNENIFSWLDDQIPTKRINSEIIVKHKTTKNFTTFNWFTIELSYKTECQTIEILCFKNWFAPSSSFPNVSSFVQFVMESNEIFINYDSVLVTCHDGVFASGLFVTMSSIIQQIKTEGICDVYSCVRDIRRYCHRFVNDKKQYCYLLEAAQICLKESILYGVR